MTLAQRFHAARPGVFFLDEGAPEALQRWMTQRQWLQPGESVLTLASAGEGNMNLTLRLTTTARTLILKQSRPWVERYPQLEAPEARALSEAAFYQAIASSSLVARMPRLLKVASTARVLLLEDLGQAADLSSLYTSAQSLAPELPALLDWLGQLHLHPAAPTPTLRNRAMRQLNHAHQFQIPLVEDNGLDLEGLRPGLTEQARRLQADTTYVREVHALGERYLQDGPTLLHGDFYPGSFLRTPQGLRIIDAEFCFLGPSAFDVGVLWAHAWLTGLPIDLPELLQHYPARGQLDHHLTRQFAGVELMRRLIGYAQLPHQLDLSQIAALLRTSHDWVCS